MTAPRGLVLEVLQMLLDDAETIDTMRSGDVPHEVSAAPLADVCAAVRTAAGEGLIEDEPRYLPILGPDPSEEERFRARWWRLTPAGERLLRDLRLVGGVDVPRWIDRAAHRALANVPDLARRDLWLTWHEDDASDLILDVEEGGRLETRVTCHVGSPTDEDELVAFLTAWLRDNVPPAAAEYDASGEA